MYKLCFGTKNCSVGKKIFGLISLPILKISTACNLWEIYHQYKQIKVCCFFKILLLQQNNALCEKKKLKIEIGFFFKYKNWLCEISIVPAKIL